MVSNCEWWKEVVKKGKNLSEIMHWLFGSFTYHFIKIIDKLGAGSQENSGERLETIVHR